jgi:parvulin-like peptidyl-prolyl isomerase
MDKRKITVAAIVVVACVAAAWAFGLFGGTDPVVAEMQQLRDQMRDLPETERRAQWDNFRQRMEGLTDAQREALRGDRNEWQQFAQQRMDEFFQLPPNEQRQRLDEMIDRMEQRRKERAQNASANQGGRDMTDAQRDKRRKERLDRTNPKMRAQFTEFGRRMNDRRTERGLPPMEGGPGRGGGGPWRG